jgi:hypothetical protein
MGSNECHLALGHGGDFHHYNPNVMGDVAAFKADPSQAPILKDKAKAARLLL